MKKLLKTSQGAKISSYVIRKFSSFHYAAFFKSFFQLWHNAGFKRFIKKCSMNRLRTSSAPASALLLSFFMMTMLILVSISVSILVVHDVRTVGTIVGGTQALYAAEGTTELGLVSVELNLPGYEPTFENYTLSNSTVASATLHAREAVVPCEGQDDDGWGQLDPNESVQLALFAQEDAEGNFLKNTSFTVDFYVGDEEGNSLFTDMTEFLTKQDILRWKILGLYYAQTEAISEYIPLDTTNSRTTRDNPTQFGPGSDGLGEGYKYAKFYDSGTPSRFYPAYPISTFLANHDYSYLILTNVIQNDEDAYIYYRLHWSTGTETSGGTSELDSVVCEYTEISSTGDSPSGDARQLLKTYVREGENLPVFDFVLYHTKDDEEEDSGPLEVDIVTPLSWGDLFGE